MAEINRLREADRAVVRDINRLLRQLYTKEGPRINMAKLKELLRDPHFEMWVAREGMTVVGMAVIVESPLLRGKICHIEDVVVHEGMRGKGIGKSLVKKLIARAREKKFKRIDLTSRPFRVAANEMYKKLGFEKQETNVYRMAI